jgi:hypothetical protein
MFSQERPGAPRVDSETTREGRMHRPHSHITVGLRKDFDRYDLTFPLLPATHTGTPPLDLTNLVPFRDRTRYHSSFPAPGRFDDTTPPMAARFTDYDQFLVWLSQRITLAPNRTDRLAWYLAWRRQRPSIAAIDDYIRTRLFDRPFDPADGHWRLLLLPAVLDHLTRALAQDTRAADPPPRRTPYRLSECPTLVLPTDCAVPVQKCIYTHQAVAAHERPLEGALLAWAQTDPGVLALCRIDPHHPLVRVPYWRTDGSQDAFVPDLLVRMAAASYLVSLRAAGNHGDGRRCRRAVVEWCARANALGHSNRGGPCWYYAPLAADELASGQRSRRYLGDLLAQAQWQASYQVRVDGGAG